MGLITGAGLLYKRIQRALAHTYILLLCVNNVCSAGPTIVFIICHSMLSSQQINGETSILSLECIPHNLSHVEHLWSVVLSMSSTGKVMSLSGKGSELV